MKQLHPFLKVKLIRYLIPVGLSILCFGLKSNEGLNSPESLLWMLKPLSLLVTWLSGISFVFDNTIGFIDTSGTIILGPSCSGLSFMIIILLLSAFYFFPVLTIKKQLLFTIPLILLSWALTMAVNASRILVSIVFLRHSHTFHALGTNKMHEALGIVYYLSFLLIYFFIVRHLLTKKFNHEQPA